MNHTYQTTDKRLREAMLQVFGNKCFYSGRPIENNNFEIDHIVPKSRGGEDSVYNYVLASKDINRKKRDRIDKETIAKLLYIVKIVYAPKVLRLLDKIDYSILNDIISIPLDSFAKLKGVSGTTYFVYGLFRAKLKDGSDIVTFSYYEANEMGISSSVFFKAIKTLINIKLLEVIEQGQYGGRTPTKYRLV